MTVNRCCNTAQSRAIIRCAKPSRRASAHEQRTVDPAEILVAAGSQQGLFLLASTMIEPGDLVAIESPTYLGALQVFRAPGARLLAIPVDADGMRVELLEDLITRRRPKLIYTLTNLSKPDWRNDESRPATTAADALRALSRCRSSKMIPYGALRYEGSSGAVAARHGPPWQRHLSQHRIEDALSRIPHRLDRRATAGDRASGADEADCRS